MTRSEPAPRVESGDAFSWRFVTPLLMGSVLNPVNSSLLATALAPIARAVHVPVGRTAILVSVLYLACVVAQPTAGKLSEEFGPRRVFLVGIVTVLVGGLVGGFGQDLSTLVVARILIGVGTSAGYPSAMLMIRRRADAAGLAEPPGAVLGGLLLAGIGVLTIGFPLGGVLVYAWGWRAMFFVNVPVTLVTLALTAAWIPRDPPVVATSLRSMASRIDVAGVVGFGTAMTLLLVFLLSLPRPAWVVLGAAVLVGTALVAWELRAQRPFVDVRLLIDEPGPDPYLYPRRNGHALHLHRPVWRDRVAGSRPRHLSEGGRPRPAADERDLRCDRPPRCRGATWCGYRYCSRPDRACSGQSAWRS